MDEVTKLLGKIAPWIAAGAAGPAGLAAMAIKTAAQALGAQDETAAAVATAAAGATPEQLAALQTAERDFQVRMRALGFENLQRLEALAVDDRKDARAMQVAVRSRVPAVLAILITLGFFAVLAAMLFNIWQPSDNQALLILLGSLGTSWGAVVNYYFGSSAGSARKDELLAQAPAVER